MVNLSVTLCTLITLLSRDHPHCIKSGGGYCPRSCPTKRGKFFTSTSTWAPLPSPQSYSRPAQQLPIWPFRSVCGRWLWRTPISDVMREVPTMSREAQRGGNTHTHTHTGLCTGLRTDNSSSYRGEKFCQRRHTWSIYLLFIVRSIY